jgi:hypothetical protein
MRMNEDFTRCEKCNQGWFEEKKFVLVDKHSPLQWGKPMFHRVEYQLQCVGCGHIQWKYTDDNY